MRKEDLKTGDIVLFRNGDKHIVLKETRYFNRTEDLLINLKNGCYSRLKEYDDDLKKEYENKNYDIIKVCAENYVGDTLREHIINNTGEWTWEREEEVKEMTVDEISEKLGYKIKVVGEDR